VLNNRIGILDVLQCLTPNGQSIVFWNYNFFNHPIIDGLLVGYDNVRTNNPVIHLVGSQFPHSNKIMGHYNNTI